MLEPDVAQAIAITLHELATNAAKYGALSRPNGHVRLEWSHTPDGRLRLRWMETGGPLAQKPTRKGFVSRIIVQMIDQQIGKVRFDWRKRRACLRNYTSGVRMSAVGTLFRRARSSWRCPIFGAKQTSRLRTRTSDFEPLPTSNGSPSQSPYLRVRWRRGHQRVVGFAAFGCDWPSNWRRRSICNLRPAGSSRSSFNDVRSLSPIS